MLTDYHIHPRITEDPAAFDEFARCALEKGIGEVCITDHMPLSVSNAKDRIPAGKVREYCDQVRLAAEKYKGVLTVKLGIEIDYHPLFIGEIENVLKEGDFDYVLGSTHLHLFLKDQLNGSMTRNEFARRALENTLAAVKSDYFHAVAHFDMFRWVFAQPERFAFSGGEYRAEEYTELICEILDETAKRKMYLEINPHFAEKSGDIHRVYPEIPIVQAALARNIPFRFGSDAHKPESVGAMLDVISGHPVYGKALGGKADENI